VVACQLKFTVVATILFYQFYKKKVEKIANIGNEFSIVFKRLYNRDFFMRALIIAKIVKNIDFFQSDAYE